ncbi:class I SAM-dependent methyltransferase [Pedobacter arcticus]|uniref:class I SAM-dependent methyltransferase n=1 Tax=Pedobacter arcticus TaxID=752140 RepID=UPI00031B176E|nr:class I SAM-dependent methyltransferase [Pedobacter arcticus]
MNKILRTALRRFIEKKGFVIYRKSSLVGNQNAFEYNSPTNTDKYYSSITNLRDYLSKSRTDAFEEILDITKKNLSNKPLQILDAGCGCGFLTTLIKKQFPEASVTGIDHSDVAVAYANKNFSDIVFEQTDLYTGRLDKFDLIFCSSVLEHLSYPEIIISNFANSLNENGRIIITVPNGRMDFFDGHIHFWSPESWQLLLEKVIPKNSFKIHLLKSKPDILTIIS